MEDKTQISDALIASSHIIILISYTIFSVVLIGESILLSWEKWAIPLIIAGSLSAWLLHISQQLTEIYRLWVYSILMMVTFFFYGIHQTSVYDLAAVMIFVIMIYSMTGQTGLVNLCMISYYLTMMYDIYAMVGKDQSWDTLRVTRTLLHLALVYMAGYTAKQIMRKWKKNQQISQFRKDALLEMTRRTDDFLTNVSHELRTPVNAVIGLTEVMLKKETDEELKKDMQSVQSAGHQVEKQLGDILDYTEIDTKKLKINKENYMISSIVNDLITECRLVWKDNSELIFDIEPQTPGILVGDNLKIKKILWHLITNSIKFTRSGCIYVHVFPIFKPYGINLCIEVSDTGIGMDSEEVEKVCEKFYQVESGRDRFAGGLGMGLTIINGFVKAMGGFMSIESAKGQGTTVRVSIPQNVAGVDQCMTVEKRENLQIATYLRFQQFDTTKVREYYNEMMSNMMRQLGLTVYRVNKLAELQKVRELHDLTHLFIGACEYQDHMDYIEELSKEVCVIVVADQDFAPEEGSNIRILRKPFYCFPAASLLSAAAKKEEVQRERYMYCPGVRVLVVDDEPMNLLVAEGIFRDYGMEVATAGSGKKALQLCETERFDLIFMDHMMPEMDGVETMKRLRESKAESGEELCIIALTANAMSSAKDMLLSEDFDGFVSKPIDVPELERTLKRVLPMSAVSYRYKDDFSKNTSSDSADKTAGQDCLTKLEKFGIDISVGLNYCRNDREFYESLLLKFAEDTRMKQKEIQDSCDREDWNDYEIRVHALKSTSKMIGALELSEMAKALECAAKDKDIGTIKEEHLTMMERYRGLSENIGEVLQKNKPSEQTISKEDVPEIEKEDLLVMLRELEDSLKTYEEERAEELIHRASGFRYGDILLGEKLEIARKYVENYEMESALKEVRAMIDYVAG